MIQYKLQTLQINFGKIVQVKINSHLLKLFWINVWFKFMLGKIIEFKFKFHAFEPLVWYLKQLGQMQLEDHSRNKRRGNITF